MSGHDQGATPREAEKKDEGGVGTTIIAWLFMLGIAWQLLSGAWGLVFGDDHKAEASSPTPAAQTSTVPATTHVDATDISDSDLRRLRRRRVAALEVSESFEFSRSFYDYAWARNALRGAIGQIDLLRLSAHSLRCKNALRRYEYHLHGARAGLAAAYWDWHTLPPPYGPINQEWGAIQRSFKAAARDVTQIKARCLSSSRS